MSVLEMNGDPMYCDGNQDRPICMYTVKSKGGLNQG